MNIQKSELLKELTFKTSRSGGKGGQNVNKVSTKVELNLDIDRSELFNPDEKERLKQKLAHKIIAGGTIQVVTEEERTQLGNKERGVEKLLKLLHAALHQDAPRKATKPRRSAVEKRLKVKQQQAFKKINRRKDWLD